MAAKPLSQPPSEFQYWDGHDLYGGGKFVAGYLLDMDQEPELREVGRFNCAGIAERVAEALNRTWHPIACAPRDAPGLLLWNGHWIGRGSYIEPNYEGDPEWFGEDSAIVQPPPTHWMRLPEPPTGAP